jgi:hypothetical protein
MHKLPHYKYENIKLWYRRAIKDTSYVEVPPRSTRYDLIQSEHLLGHFPGSTVYNSLIQKY